MSEQLASGFMLIYLNSFQKLLNNIVNQINNFPCSFQDSKTKPQTLDDLAQNKSLPLFQDLIKKSQNCQAKYATQIIKRIRGTLCTVCIGVDQISEFFDINSKLYITQASVIEFQDAVNNSISCFSDLVSWNKSDNQDGFSFKIVKEIVSYYIDSTCQNRIQGYFQNLVKSKLSNSSNFCTLEQIFSTQNGCLNSQYLIFQDKQSPSRIRLLQNSSQQNDFTVSEKNGSNVFISSKNNSKVCQNDHGTCNVRISFSGIYQFYSGFDDDVFSIGRILLEVFLQRPLQPLECNNIKTQFILEGIPELANHQHLNFVKDILANMVYHNENQRFQPAQLLQVLNNYLIDELCLQSLILPAFSSENYVQTLKKIKIEHFSDLNKIYEYQDIQINLQNYNIFSKEAKTIAQNIEKCSNVSRLTLNLQDNYLFAGGAKKIGSSLEKCDNLAYLCLNLQGNHIQSDGAKNIGSSLEKCLNLCFLNLNLVGNYIGSEGAKFIGSSLEKCQSITHLDLNLQSNYLFVEGAKSIGMSLQRCQNIINLNLNLQLNEICDEGAKGIRKSLQNCQNITSLFLSLQSNQINQDGVKNIRQLSKKCSKLVEAAFYF
ncbi:hypothetical protein ABPG72_022301 [Tetrahymena utriculariae]